MNCGSRSLRRRFARKGFGLVPGMPHILRPSAVLPLQPPASTRYRDRPPFHRAVSRRSAIGGRVPKIPTAPPTAWFRERRYPHFDFPLSESAATKLVTSFEVEATHAFMPFLSFEKISYHYKKCSAEDSPHGKKRKLVSKKRPIAYASHSDSAIYSYYSAILGGRYDQELCARGLSESVLAYRKFDTAKCNIHFANEVFGLIDGSSINTAIAFDIEKFFDTIDHRLLKSAWLQVTENDRLSAPEFAVYKSITQYASVESKAAISSLGISKRAYKKWRGRLCSIEDFEKRIRHAGLISRNDKRIGIPQGSPISAVLSNIYMLPFDLAVKAECDKRNAYYRRYSDDIMILCNDSYAEELSRLLRDLIRDRKLKIQDAKTEISRFSFDKSTLKADRSMQYLGFTFDGENSRIRPQSLARFYQKMKAAVKAAARTAAKTTSPKVPLGIYRQALYGRFSHLRHRESKERATSRAKPNDKRNKTFAMYVFRAARLMKSSEIRAQFKGHWGALDSEIKKRETMPRNKKRKR